jgi:hypothetical protein
MKKPVAEETSYKMLHLSDSISYCKSNGVTDKDKRELLDEKPKDGSFDELLINVYLYEVGDLNNFIVDIE